MSFIQSSTETLQFNLNDVLNHYVFIPGDLKGGGKLYDPRRAQTAWTEFLDLCLERVKILRTKYGYNVPTLIQQSIDQGGTFAEREESMTHFSDREDHQLLCELGLRNPGTNIDNFFSRLQRHLEVVHIGNFVNYITDEKFDSFIARIKDWSVAWFTAHESEINEIAKEGHGERRG